MSAGPRDSATPSATRADAAADVVLDPSSSLKGQSDCAARVDLDGTPSAHTQRRRRGGARDAAETTGDADVFGGVPRVNGERFGKPAGAETSTENRQSRRCAACKHRFTSQGPAGVPDANRTGQADRPASFSAKRVSASANCRAPAKRIRLPSSLTDEPQQQDHPAAREQVAKQYRKCPVCGAPCAVAFFSGPTLAEPRRPSRGAARRKQNQSPSGTSKRSTRSASRSSFCVSPPDFSFVLEDFDPLARAGSPSPIPPLVGGVEAEQPAGSNGRRADPEAVNGARPPEAADLSVQLQGKQQDKRPRYSLGTEMSHLTVDGANFPSSILPVQTEEISSAAALSAPPAESQTQTSERGSRTCVDMKAGATKIGFDSDGDRRGDAGAGIRDDSRDFPLLTRSMLYHTAEASDVTRMYRPLVRKRVRTALGRILRALRGQAGFHPLLCEVFELDMGLMVESCSDLCIAEEHQPAATLAEVRDRLEPLSRKLHYFETIAKKPLTAAQVMVLVRDQIHLGSRATRHTMFSGSQLFKGAESSKSAT